MSARVRFTIYSKTAYELISMLSSEELIIPAHQRDYCWPPARAGAFIGSVLAGIPTQSIIMRKVDRAAEQLSLEDGSQRLRTLKKYMNDEIMDLNGFKFSALTAAEQNDVRMYQFAVTLYWNETIQQRIDTFDNFQNGVALSVGERLHSMCEISPLVTFTKNLLLTPGSGLHDRAARIWGVRDGKDAKGNHLDKRRKWLLNAVALVAGIAFGPDAITKKWPDFQNQTTRYLSTPIDERAVREKVEALISIYEQVEIRRPMPGKTILNSQWDMAKFSAYIVYSFWEELDMDHLTRGWVDFLVGARNHPERLPAILHRDIKATRSWNKERWQMGYLRVFWPEDAERRAAASVGTRSSEEDEDDEI